MFKRGHTAHGRMLVSASVLRSSLLAWPLIGAQVPAPATAMPADRVHSAAPADGVPWTAPADGVQWTAPPDCPDRSALLAGILRRLGKPLVPGQVAVDARVVKVGPRFSLRVQLLAGERREQRELTADSCPPLLDATALLIAHAVDAANAAAAATATPATDEVLPPDPTPDFTAPLDPAPTTAAPVLADPLELAATPATPATPRGPGFALRLQGGPELGAVPGITGGVGFGVGLLWRRFRLELQGDYLAPRTITATRTSVRASLLAGSVHGCVRLGRGALELPICGGLELGGMRGDARGPTADAATLGPWLAVVLSTGVAWHVRPRLSLSATLQVVGGVVRSRFVLEGPGDAILLFRPAPVSGRLMLGLELRLRDPW